MSVDATKIAEPERFLQAFALILLVGTGAVFAVRGHRGLALSLLLLTLFAWGRADCFGLWRASKDCCFVGYLVSEITYALIVRLGSVLISLGVVASLTADLGTQSFEIVTVIRRLEPLGWVTLFFFYFLFVSRNGLELWAYLLGATETEPPATMGGIYSSVVRLVVHLSAHLAILSGLGMASGLSETYEPLFIGSIAILLPTVLGNAQTGLLTLEESQTVLQLPRRPADQDVFDHDVRSGNSVLVGSDREGGARPRHQAVLGTEWCEQPHLWSRAHCPLE